ncbi:MAG: hypothetical protein P8X61_11535, partial [Limibacillus sp.]
RDQHVQQEKGIADRPAKGGEAAVAPNFREERESAEEQQRRQNHVGGGLQCVALIWFAPRFLFLLSSGLGILYWPILLTGLLFWIVRETYADQGSCFFHGMAELEKQGAAVNARLR